MIELVLILFVTCAVTIFWGPLYGNIPNETVPGLWPFDQLPMIELTLLFFIFLLIYAWNLSE